MADEKETGARSFAHLLTQIDNGQLHAELSEEVRSVAKALVEHSKAHGREAKGSLTIVLRLTADKDESVEIVGDVSTKLPKVTRARTITWLDKDGQLVLTNPKQLAFQGVREVPSAGPTRSIEPAPAKVVR